MVNNANFRPADKYAMRVTKNIITTQGTLCKSNCAPFMGQLKTQDMFKKNQPNLLTNFSIKKKLSTFYGMGLRQDINHMRENKEYM